MATNLTPAQRRLMEQHLARLGVAASQVVADMNAPKRLTDADVDAWVQGWLDSVAASYQFGTAKTAPMASAAGFVNSTVPRFRDTARALTDWRDQVHLALYALRDAAKAGGVSLPTDLRGYQAVLPQPPTI